MKSQSNSLLGRSRAVARLGVAAVLVLAAVGACSSDTTGSGPSGGAGGGSGGKGGASSAGGKGGTAHAGDTSPTAGSSVTTAGDTGNTGEGGQAEAGAPGNGAALCGNGKVEPGEECDDGNTKNGDGCSATCKAKCEQCEQTNCFASDPLDVHVDARAAFEACYGDDALAKTPAEGGPAAGTPRNKLCQDLVSCVRRTGCATTPSDPIKTCLCGSASVQDCTANATGPCAEEIAAAAESRTFNDIQVRADLGDITFGVGMAYSILSQCDAAVCQRECLQDKVATECDKCLLFDRDISGVRNPISDNYIDCGQPYGTCYFSAPSTESSTCTAAADCAIRTGCGAQGAAVCYGNGAGPCAQEFAAASMSTDAAVIPSRIDDVQYPSGNAADLLRCAAHDCRAACFPGASGGAGGSGGGGTSGGGTGGGGTGGGGTGGGGTGGGGIAGSGGDGPGGSGG